MGSSNGGGAAQSQGARARASARALGEGGQSVHTHRHRIALLGARARARVCVCVTSRRTMATGRDGEEDQGGGRGHHHRLARRASVPFPLSLLSFSLWPHVAQPALGTRSHVRRDCFGAHAIQTCPRGLVAEDAARTRAGICTSQHRLATAVVIAALRDDSALSVQGPRRTGAPAVNGGESQ